MAFNALRRGLGKAPSNHPLSKGYRMYAPLEVLEPQLPLRRMLTEDTEVETLFFVDLNSEEAVERPPARDLPEELTGTYYTG